MKDDKYKLTESSTDQVNWGGNDDPLEFMKIGDIVTLSETEIHSWHTKFYFKEFPGKEFNSVSFEKV